MTHALHVAQLCSHSTVCQWLPLAAAIELQTQLDNYNKVLTVKHAMHLCVIGFTKRKLRRAGNP